MYILGDAVTVLTIGATAKVSNCRRDENGSLNVNWACCDIHTSRPLTCLQLQQAGVLPHVSLTVGVLKDNQIEVQLYCNHIDHFHTTLGRKKEGTVLHFQQKNQFGADSRSLC